MSDNLKIQYVKDYPANPDPNNPSAARGYVKEAEIGDVVTLSASVARDRVAQGFAEFIQ